MYGCPKKAAGPGFNPRPRLHTTHVNVNPPRIHERQAAFRLLNRYMNGQNTESARRGPKVETQNDHHSTDSCSIVRRTSVHDDSILSASPGPSWVDSSSEKPHRRSRNAINARLLWLDDPWNNSQ